jgi:hypothetical protein
MIGWLLRVSFMASWILIESEPEIRGRIPLLFRIAAATVVP